MAPLTAAQAIRKYLRDLEPGTVFTPVELVRLRLGSEDSVRQTLHRMMRAGTVRRLSKGYYDIPASSPLIGVLRPTPEAIIAAHARKTGATIQRPELDAANKLGLTTQVVARPVYRTDLFPRALNIGGQTIRLKTAGPRSLARDNDPAELVIDALRAVGKAHITDKDIAKAREFVREHRLEKNLRQRARRVPSWMLPVIDGILGEKQRKRG